MRGDERDTGSTSGCESPWGPEADRRRNLLILLTPEGSRSGADPQLMSRATPFAMPIRAARGDHSASHFHHRMPLLKRIAARLMGFDGAYHRFTGKVTIEKFERSLRVERFDDRAI